MMGGEGVADPSVAILSVQVDPTKIRTPTATFSLTEIAAGYEALFVEQ